jgi:protein O-GlcNAc transferase
MMNSSHQPSDLGFLLGQALEFHRAGNLAAAQQLYGQILDVSPQHFDALRLLALVRRQQGRREEACELIAAACAADPTSIGMLLELGNVRLGLGRYEEAITAYDRALAIEPCHAEALNNRGAALCALDRPAAAAMSYDRAIALRPDYADAHHNRAGVMCDLGRHQEAIAGYDMAIALRPDDVRFHFGRARALASIGKFDAAIASFNCAVVLRPQKVDLRYERGLTLSALGRHQEALGEFDIVLAKEPDDAAALNRRGIALLELGRFDDADASFLRAIALCPDDAGALDNRGVLLQKLRRFEEALDLHDHALAIRPDDVAFLHHRGDALQGLQRHLEAIVTYDRALDIKPNDHGLLMKRGAAFNDVKLYLEAVAGLDAAIEQAPDFAQAHCHRGTALKGMAFLPEALASFEKALAIDDAVPCAFDGYADCAVNMCDWTRTAQVEVELQEHIAAKKTIIAPFTLLAYGVTPALQLAAARTYLDGQFGNSPAPMRGGTRRHHDRLRIAYLCDDFSEYAASARMAELFARHDRSKFDVTGIALGSDEAADTSTQIAATFDRLHDVRDLGDRDAARLINELEIDIAVDLMGYGRNGRPGILWRRPAPVQVSYLGHPGTMGTDFVDYIIADAVVAPPGEDRFYAEKVVRLPDCCQVNDSRRPISKLTPTRMEEGLPEHSFVFCCFNDNYMITAAVFDIWMRLLATINGSVLWLRRDHDGAADNLRGAAAARGVDPARLVFADRIAPADHLARHRLADLCLDTLPCNGQTACGDALWAGLPVLTCSGGAFAGRISASMLQSIGLPELVTTSLTDYGALALWLAQDPALLAEIRTRLAENRLSCPLFDTDLSRRHIESAYLAMWRRRQRGEAPKSFAVESDDFHESPREITVVAA